MPTDGRTDDLQTIDARECLRLLATQEVGRLGLVAQHYPLVIPVNYGLDGDVVVIRTHPGMLLGADHMNVTFQVDEIDRAHHTGWTVLVRGMAERVTEEHEAELVARTRATRVTPWAPGEHAIWLRIIPHRIDGRRIVAGLPVLPFGEAAGYP